MSDAHTPSNGTSACPACGASAVPGSVLCGACGAPLGGASASTGPLDPLRENLGAFAPGQALGDRYTIVERAGAGGMGLIYKAIDRRLGRSVALKLIQAGVAERPGARERFRREIALAQQVTHPNVCRVHDLGEVEGQPFISMEYVEGQTLETLVRSMGHLSPGQTVAIAKQIAAGLQAIHERSIVHRDLKPANVMVDRLGHAVLMDFGMAYHEDHDRLTQVGAVFGTLAYLAPEQARGKADMRSDLYALGLILYETLTGRRPPGDEGAVPLALRPPDDACPPPSHFSPEVPAALDALVMRCLERLPEKRYGSARELVEVMQQFEGDLTRSGLFSREIAQVAPVARRRRGWLAAAAAVALGVGAYAGRGYLARPAAPQAPMSIAFLPLAYSGSEEHAYLKNLLPMVLSQELQAAPGIVVTPFAVSRTFGADEDPRSVARQLGVAMVVKGRLEPPATDGRAAIGFRALNADGKETWSERLTAPSSEVLARSSEVTRSLARGLGIAAPSTPTRPAGALKHYLDGMALLEGWDIRQNYVQAEAAFGRAVAADPHFAEAHAGLAQAYWRHYNSGTREPELVERAHAAAERAVSLAPSLPEAHLALGLVLLGRGRSAEASAELEQAERLAPASDAIYTAIGGAYESMGRPSSDVERLYRRALDLRPGYWWNSNNLGSYYLRVGRLSDAQQLFKRVIELRPESDAGYSNLAATYLLSNEPARAVPLLEAALRLSPSWETHNNLGFVYYSQGEFAAAAREFRSATEDGAQQAMPWGNLGDAYRQLGRRAEANSAYSRAVTLWEQRLALAPNDAEALAIYAMNLAGKGACEKSRGAGRRAIRAGATNPNVRYYAAVAAAICGDTSTAIREAVLAIEGGVRGDVQTNPDLRPLLDQPALQRLLRAPADQPTRGPGASS